jgi:hypothetical protein
MRLEVRHYHDRDEGRHQGGNKPTVPSSARVYQFGEVTED